jgi:hypothetical protein
MTDIYSSLFPSEFLTAAHISAAEFFREVNNVQNIPAVCCWWNFMCFVLSLDFDNFFSRSVTGLI